MTTPEIKEAVEFEDIFLQDKIERRAYEQREKAIRDYYSYMNSYKNNNLLSLFLFVHTLYVLFYPVEIYLQIPLLL